MELNLFTASAIPLRKTAANVNLDSLNVLVRTHDFIPLGAERSSLKAVVEAVAREIGMRVSPDARPEQDRFYRSYHFPFCARGSSFDQFEKEWN